MTNSFFNSWVVGSAPGAEVDIQAQRDSSIKYTIHSKQLIDANNFPLTCAENKEQYQALTTNFGIEDWLRRVADDSDPQLSALTSYDAPTYNTNVTATVDGAGSLTYNFPLGTDFLGGFAKYVNNQTLSIVMVKDDGKPIETVIPPGEFGQKAKKISTVGVSGGAARALDALQAEQLLRNLNTNLGRLR